MYVPESWLSKYNVLPVAKLLLQRLKHYVRRRLLSLFRSIGVDTKLAKSLFRSKHLSSSYKLVSLNLSSPYLFFGYSCLTVSTLACRSCLAKRNHVAVRENNAAITIQRLVRGWFARKSYKAQRHFIIHIQSCIRRNIARKQLFHLRSEARSASHFKEVSYALENKVVELTQTLTAIREEKKSAQDRSVQLEAQIKTWMDKFEKMERRAKSLDERLQEPTVPQEQYDTLQNEFNTLTADHRATVDKAKSQEKEITLLRTQLETEKQETSSLRKQLEEAEERSKNATDESEVAELRSQLSALKVQLSQALNTPRRQQNNNGGLRALSPAPGLRNLSPSPNRAFDERQRSRSPHGGLYPTSTLSSEITPQPQLFTSADISKRPSEALTSCIRGESPQRTMIEVGVFETTSK